MIEKDKLILLNDDDLMENICRGNDDAFTELFNRYKSGVVNFVYRQCGDYGKSEDIAQECFLRVYNNARSYKANGKFKNWILTIAVNVTRSILVKKSEKHISLNPDFETADKNTKLEKEIEHNEIEQIVQNALSKIPNEQREIIILKHFNDLKFNEIAEILNCPVGTVRSRLRYGLLKLSELLKGSGYYTEP